MITRNLKPFVLSCMICVSSILAFAQESTDPIFYKGKFEYNDVWYELSFSESNVGFYKIKIEVDSADSTIGTIRLATLEANKGQFDAEIVDIIDAKGNELQVYGKVERLYLEAVKYKNAPDSDNKVAGHIYLKRKVNSFAVPKNTEYKRQKRRAKYRYERSEKLFFDKYSIDRKSKVLKELYKKECFNDELFKKIEDQEKRKLSDIYDDYSDYTFDSLNALIRKKDDQLKKLAINKQRTDPQSNERDSVLKREIDVLNLQIARTRRYVHLAEILKTGCISSDSELVWQNNLNMDSLQLGSTQMAAGKGLKTGGMLLDLLSLYREHYRMQQYKIDYARMIKAPFEQYKKTLIVDSVEFEFFEGNIKNIILVGKLENGNGTSAEQARETRVYHNISTVSFSDISDYKRLSKELLVAFHESNRNMFMIWLSDLMAYVPKLHLYTEDYSPKNQIIRLKPPQPPEPIQLDKEASDELFEARIFSDFVGLQEDNANGLIQTEVSKKIILLPGRGHVPLIRDFRRRFQIGTLNFIEPRLAFIKIEGNNRELDLQLNNTGDSLTRLVAVNDSTTNTETIAEVEGIATTLDLIRFANFNVGATLNLGVFDWRRLKSSFYLNAGLDYFRTAVRDSSAFVNAFSNPSVGITTSNANIFTYSLEAVWTIKPDPRYGVESRFRTSWMDLRTENLRRVNALVEPDDKLRNSFFQLQFDLTFRPSQDKTNKNKLFFRSIYTSLYGKDNDRDFFQALVGYSFYLLKK
ncbi:MAG: hypothetical protein AAFX87_15010 [Bacteroidota bacterium]